MILKLKGWGDKYEPFNIDVESLFVLKMQNRFFVEYLYH